MKNKTKISISIFAVAIGSILISEYSSSADANRTGAPAGRTGSPGDNAATCGSSLACHSAISIPFNTPNLATTLPGLIISDIPLAGYTPGHSYTITGTIASPGKVRFGFEISPQNNAGTTLGSITLSDTTTQIVTLGAKHYITHKLSGTLDTTGTHSKSWSFNWTAPAVGTGDVTFYGMFVIANNDGSASNLDSLRKSTLLVHENTATGIAEYNNISNQISVYPNPVNNNFFIINNSNVQDDITVTISDSNGKAVKKIQNISSQQPINISDLTSGIYFLQIETSNGNVVKKIIKE